jgi:hypothetical protein
MHPKDDVVRIEAGRERYDGGCSPDEYEGTSEKSPVESSRVPGAAAVEGRVLSALLTLRIDIMPIRRSLLPSAALDLPLAGLPYRNRGWPGSISSPYISSTGIAGAIAGAARKGRSGTGIGGVACCVESYAMAKTGIELDRLFTCFRPALRRDFFRTSSGICTCIFFARRRNDFMRWLCDVDGRIPSLSHPIGVAC